MKPGDGNGKIYLGIPRERIYLTQFVDCRDSILARLHQSGIGSGYYQAEGHRVDRNRDTICWEFWKHKEQPEWLVMIDTDMEHVEDLPERLVRWNVPIIGGLYFHRGQSHDPFAFRNGPPMKDKYGREHRTWAPMRDEVYEYLMSKGIPLRDGAVAVMDDDPNALREVDAVATGALCIHRSVIEAMLPGPWFEYKTGGISEDLMFCADAKEQYGFPVYCDFSTISGHYHWVAMGQSQFRMNYENRGINITSYTKRHAAEMWANAFGVTEEKALVAIEKGSPREVSKLWRRKFGMNGQPSKVMEERFYKSKAVGKAYAMELLHWNYTTEFQMLRQMLTHIRKQNVIEIGSGIGSVALQLLIQRNNVLAVEVNSVLQDFIRMRHKVLADNIEGDIGELSIVKDDWIENCEDGSFHTAVSFDTFEHLPEDVLRSVVAGLARVLQLNGHLIYHANWRQQDIYPMHHDYSHIWSDILAQNGFTQITTMEAVKVRQT